MTSSIEQFTGAYATPEIVGREDTLATITRLLQTKEDSPQVIYLHAKGGYGKSRLLTKVLELCQSMEGIEGAAHLIDLYHHQNHTPIALTDAIVEAFPATERFHGYYQARRRYTKASLADNVTDRDIAFRKVFTEFSTALAGMGAEKRVVIALDTLERLVYTAREERISTKEEAEYAEVWSWLLEQIQKWQNVTLLMAGRPESEFLVDEIKALETVKVKVFEVKAFDEEQSRQYFNAAEQVARNKGATLIADRIAALGPDDKRKAYERSKGKPVYLALYIDHLALSSSDDDLLGDGAIDDFEAQFVQRLMESEGGELIVLLGRLPKGADAEMLSALLGVEDKETRDVAGQLDQVLSLSFVKSSFKDFNLTSLYQDMLVWIYGSNEKGPVYST